MGTTQLWPISSSSLPTAGQRVCPVGVIKTYPSCSTRPLAGILAKPGNLARPFSGKAWWGACTMNVLVTF